MIYFLDEVSYSKGYVETYDVITVDLELLILQSAGITDRHYHIWFMWCWIKPRASHMLGKHSTDGAMSLLKGRDCVQLFSHNEYHGDTRAQGLPSCKQHHIQLMFTATLWDQWRVHYGPQFIDKNNGLHLIYEAIQIGSDGAHSRAQAVSHMRIHDTSVQCLSQGKGRTCCLKNTQIHKQVIQR